MDGATIFQIAEHRYSHAIYAARAEFLKNRERIEQCLRRMFADAIAGVDPTAGALSISGAGSIVGALLVAGLSHLKMKGKAALTFQLIFGTALISAKPLAIAKTFDSFDATLRLAAMTDQTEDFRDYITATQKKLDQQRESDIAKSIPERLGADYVGGEAGRQRYRISSRGARSMRVTVWLFGVPLTNQ